MSLHELGYLPQKLFTKACDDLVGVDTEAAEQAFHIASRWQANLSNAHATHFDLQLLLFTYEHNERNRCDLVYNKICGSATTDSQIPELIIKADRR